MQDSAPSPYVPKVRKDVGVGMVFRRVCEMSVLR
jgi:hypothetical protein